MIRGALRHRQNEPGFRWRAAGIARIEGLSDAVFAFAVTLLVVSLEVPRTDEWRPCTGSWLAERSHRAIEGHQVAQLMATFSGGYLAVSCIFLCLFLHAFREKRSLDLD